MKIISVHILLPILLNAFVLSDSQTTSYTCSQDKSA